MAKNPSSKPSKTTAKPVATKVRKKEKAPACADITAPEVVTNPTASEPEEVVEAKPKPEVMAIPEPPEPELLEPAALASKTQEPDTQESDTQKTEPPEEPTATEPRSIEPVPLNHQAPWRTQYEAVVGLSHRDMEPPLPCQDAAFARQGECHPWLVVADGAGSSAVSELGAQAVVLGLNRLLLSLESRLFAVLDSPQAPTKEEERSWSLLLAKHARGLLEDLASQHRRPLKDFRCTLLLAVVGHKHALWLKVGDGMLVAKQVQQAPNEPKGWATTLSTLGELGKGEFANQTTFIDEHLQPDQVQSGLISADPLCGLALMSDGAAERLVSLDGQKISGQLQNWLDQLSHQGLRRRQLTQRFYAEDFTSRRVADDCSIALAARVLLE